MNRKFLDRWAKAHNELRADIEATVATLDAKDARSLRRIVNRLSTTNCWYALYALRGDVLSALNRRGRNVLRRKRGSRSSKL